MEKKIIGEGDLAEGSGRLESGSGSEDRTGNPFVKSVNMLRSPVLVRRNSCGELPQSKGVQSPQMKVQKELGKKGGGQEVAMVQKEPEIIHVREPEKQKTQDTEMVRAIVTATEDAEVRNIRRLLEEADKGEAEQMVAISEALYSMKLAAAKQKNISMDIKNSMVSIENSLAILKACRTVRQNAVDGLLARAASSCVEAKPSSPVVVSERARMAGRSEKQKGHIPAVAGTSAETGKRVATSPAEEMGKKKRREEDPTSDSCMETEGEDTFTVAQSRRARQRKKAAKRKEQKAKVTETAQSKDEPRRRRRRPRPEAILIMPAEGQTYADTLKAVRTNAKPEESGTEIKAVRKTRDGGILLELGAGSKDSGRFREELRAILGEGAGVRSLGSKTKLEIRDLDCCTTVDEVESAIKSALKAEDVQIKVTVTRPNVRQQMLAIVELPSKEGNMLLSKGKIRIGWVNCRIREWTRLIQCFRCLDFGHFQADCRGPQRKSGGDCFRCGEKGHKRSDCDKEPRCMLCVAKNIRKEETAHVLGSGACHSFREALNRAKGK